MVDRAMLEAVEIQWFRGIRSAKLEGFTPISVLVGPSGCGKSTVLDAIYIATAASPPDALGRVVQRRTELPNGAKWLFWRGDPQTKSPPRFAVRASIDDHGRGQRPTAEEARHTREYQVDLGWFGPRQILPELEAELEKVTGARMTAGVRCSWRISQDVYHQWHVAFNRSNQFVIQRTNWMGEISFASTRISLPSPGALHEPLPNVFIEAFRERRLKQVIELVSDVIPGLQDLVNITAVGDEGGDLAAAFEEHVVSVGSMGAGEQALIRLCLELGGRPGDTVLVEDPEAHQHPRALRQSARAIVAAARRGVDVILSTHSLELLDDLTAELSSDELSWLSVFSMVRKDGDVHSSRHEGPMVAKVRDAVGKDYR